MGFRVTLRDIPGPRLASANIKTGCAISLRSIACIAALSGCSVHHLHFADALFTLNAARRQRITRIYSASAPGRPPIQRSDFTSPSAPSELCCTRTGVGLSGCLGPHTSETVLTPRRSIFGTARPDLFVKPLWLNGALLWGCVRRVLVLSFTVLWPVAVRPGILAILATDPPIAHSSHQTRSFCADLCLLMLSTRPRTRARPLPARCSSPTQFERPLFSLPFRSFSCLPSQTTLDVLRVLAAA